MQANNTLTKLSAKAFSNRLIRRVVFGTAAVAALLAVPTQAKAGVSLLLTDNDSSPTAVTVNPGQSFTVTLNVTSTAEKLTGVDYYFKVSGAGAGKLNLTQRDTTGTSFADTLKLDSEVTGSITGQVDLGATLTNVSNALGAGTYLLAKYTISVDANLAPGTYTLSTIDPVGSGVVREAPTFNEQGFDSHALFTVNVASVGSTLPEPAGATVLMALGGLALRRRRR